MKVTVIVSKEFQQSGLDAAVESYSMPDIHGAILFLSAQKLVDLVHGFAKKRGIFRIYYLNSMRQKSQEQRDNNGQYSLNFQFASCQVV